MMGDVQVVDQGQQIFRGAVKIGKEPPTTVKRMQTPPLGAVWVVREVSSIHCVE